MRESGEGEWRGRMAREDSTVRRGRGHERVVRHGVGAQRVVLHAQRGRATTWEGSAAWKGRGTMREGGMRGRQRGRAAFAAGEGGMGGAMAWCGREEASLPDAQTPPVRISTRSGRCFGNLQKKIGKEDEKQLQVMF